MYVPFHFVMMSENLYSLMYKNKSFVRFLIIYNSVAPDEDKQVGLMIAVQALFLNGISQKILIANFHLGHPGNEEGKSS